MEIEKISLPNKIKSIEEEIISVEPDVIYFKNYYRKHRLHRIDKKDPVYLEKRKTLREFIHKELCGNSFKPEEKEILTYLGFKIVLPKFMNINHPYVYIKRSNTYYVELSNSEMGNLVRIDNLIFNLDKYLIDLKEKLKALQNRSKSIDKELEKKNHYEPEIKKLRDELKKVDEELEVKL